MNVLPKGRLASFERLAESLKLFYHNNLWFSLRSGMSRALHRVRVRQQRLPR